MSSNCRSDLLKALEGTDPGCHLRTVLNFYAYDLKEMKICYDMVRHSIEKELQARVKIESYGSVLTGLALKDSDIDLFLTPSSYPPILYNQVVKRLRRSKCFYGVTAIRKARVPIIQCRHSATGISIDLNMSNPHGVYKSRFLAELLKCDQRLRELFLFLKIWATKLKLIGRSGLNSHCLVIMIIFSLQMNELLPSVEQMQRFCPSIIFQGHNFAYKLPPLPVLPEDISIRKLITNFFDYYSTFEFEKFVVSPFLGRCLNRSGEQLGFQLGCKNICVQDPFELNQNLAMSFSQKNLHYFKQCLVLAAQAFRDKDLKWRPKKLYDYLLFGIVEKLENAENNEIVIHTRKTTSSSPIPMRFYIHLTLEDYNGLLPIREFLNAGWEGPSTYSVWVHCQLATIRDVLTEVYGLKIESERKQHNRVQMYISGNVDTWSGRDFTPNAGQSFLSYQLLQSSNFSRIRFGNPVYAVNVHGWLTVSWNNENNMIDISLIPVLGSLEKLFQEFQHFLKKYSFKDQASIWSLDGLSTLECRIFEITLVALINILLTSGPLFLIILFITAMLFWKFLERIFRLYFLRD